MKDIITQIESTVTPSGNSGHVVVPKAWIEKEAIVTLKENESRTKAQKLSTGNWKGKNHKGIL